MVDLITMTPPRSNNDNRTQERFRRLALGIFLTLIFCAGCGTTKWSDTSRTATEQLLISSAMDDVIDEFNFYPLSGRKIFINDKGVSSTDKEYLLSILRQQLAANGTFIMEKKEDADYILEVSTGAVGTNRYDLMYGIPETSVPAVLSLGAGTTIPEISLIKKTDQKAQIKLTMWAYNQKTGAIIWQSGEKMKTASIRDRWILGAGPITKSSFNDKTQIGGDDVPYDNIFGERISKNEKPSVKTEAVYRELDHAAIDRLEEIRKDGLAALTHEPQSGDEAKVAEKGNDKEKKEGEKSPEGEKKTELKAEALPETGDNPPKVAAKSETAAPTEKAEKSDAEESKPADAVPPTPPTSVPETAPAGNVIRTTSLPLDFGTLSLPLGETVVPAK